MPPPKVKINVLLEPARFEGAAQELEDAGVAIDVRNVEIGTISGSVDVDSLPVINKVRGVLAIEVDRSLSVPDPGSDLQ